MKEDIKDLLESMIEEYVLDEDSKDDIVSDYADRILDLIEYKEDSVFYPEHTHYID